ncbi:hypothetical protein NQ318_008380 [Aromia moschata]|uniref:Uncharacterized protein n=1 Tax=Aromia moschata TaxID=1265417 RepID=A0AAV8YIG7_9CUCU|nr:hypothetical protein NQ318_008380 [Aromia moschata]
MKRQLKEEEESILKRKSSGKDQHYIYEIFDKNCVLVVGPQMERAIKDKEIIDVTIAQRSEKILVKLADGTRITLPLAPYEGNAPLYRGSGWTKEVIEQEHHHGKETMSIAKLFEAKESGVEDWELEMMRLANKRKKRCKGEDSVDWKVMLQGCLENMDWNKFEEETKQIVEEKAEVVEEENIPMEVNDMEKTTNVAEKLKQGGEEVLKQLPTMTEIPEVIKVLETGDMCELQNVSGVRVKMADGKTCFVTGQMVKTDEDEVFVPGQTIINEEGQSEYTPGITIFMNDEPTLIPGWSSKLLKMTCQRKQINQINVEDDGESVLLSCLPPDLGEYRPRRRSLSPSPPPPPKPRSKPKVEEEIVIRRRVIEEPTIEPAKQKVKKRPPIEVTTETPNRGGGKKKLKDKTKEKLLKAESEVDKLRLNMRRKLREFKIEKPKAYIPAEPVKKSKKLEELEMSIKKGTFFEDDKTKDILEKAKSVTRMLKYQHILQPFNNDFSRRF